jgi:hypothetical protein
MAHNARQQQALLADEFTALIEELEGFQKVQASAKLTDKFNRIYAALSLADENADG